MRKTSEIDLDLVVGNLRESAMYEGERGNVNAQRDLLMEAKKLEDNAKAIYAASDMIHAFGALINQYEKVGGNGTLYRHLLKRVKKVGA